MRRSAAVAGLVPLAMALATFGLAGGMARLGAETDPFRDLRDAMVDEQIVARGVTAERVIRAMREVPRHLFVPEGLRDQAYLDGPLSIGSGQTISQPYVVALMTSLLDLEGDEKILEIGTGSGYQAAVLSRIVGDVYTIEIREALGGQAERTLSSLGYDNVHVRIGDGYQGWPEAAPFDGIIVTAAPQEVPQPLIRQLREGGKLVIPVGSFFQDLLVLTKTGEGVEKQEIIPVRFVPMVGEVERQRREP